MKGRANLWTQGLEQQQYQIDIQTIEELFGQNDCQSDTKATLSRGGKNRSSLRETKEEVCVCLCVCTLADYKKIGPSHLLCWTKENVIVSFVVILCLSMVVVLCLYSCFVFLCSICVFSCIRFVSLCGSFVSMVLFVSFQCLSL